MKQQPEELRFIWDPDVNRKKSGHSPQENGQNTVRSFDDYLDFIDQFDNPLPKKGIGQHVDKQFSLY